MPLKDDLCYDIWNRLYYFVLNTAEIYGIIMLCINDNKELPL